MVRASCPCCRQPLQVPPEHLGRVIRCPACKQTFTLRLPRPPAPPPPARLEVAAATSPGLVRERNEDAFLAQHSAWADARGRHELALLLVADGMGGHSAGDRASAAAAAAFAAALAPRLAELVCGSVPPPDDDGLIELVDHGLWEASRAIARLADEAPHLADAGATAVAALVLDGRAAVCHVGDCRAYRHTAGGLRQLTRDHTLAWRMVELGTLSEAEAARLPAASHVAQALGRQHDFEPSHQALPLAAGDWLLLACDGLHGQLSPAEIAACLTGGAADAAAALVRRADEAGGSDNCTVAALRAVPSS